MERIPTFRSDEAAERFVEAADLSRYDLSGAQQVQFEFEVKVERPNSPTHKSPKT